MNLRKTPEYRALMNVKPDDDLSGGDTEQTPRSHASTALSSPSAQPKKGAAEWTCPECGTRYTSIGKSRPAQRGIIRHWQRFAKQLADILGCGTIDDEIIEAAKKLKAESRPAQEEK